MKKGLHTRNEGLEVRATLAGFVGDRAFRLPEEDVCARGGGGWCSILWGTGGGVNGEGDVGGGGASVAVVVASVCVVLGPTSGDVGPLELNVSLSGVSVSFGVP